MKGRIIKSTGSSYTVRYAEGGQAECHIRGKYRLEGLRSTNPVVVGDWVEFDLSGGGATGRITEVLPRKNYIIRKATKLSKSHQIIASNMDQLLLIVTLTQPVTHAEFIDRYLVSAEAYNIPASLLINKTDIHGSGDLDKLEEWRSIYSDIGYRVLTSSLAGGKVPASVRELLHNRVTLLAGISGVGKTTLINTLEPGLDLKVREISDYHKAGKHTTTFAEMIKLSMGGYLIDTPGIRGFGLTDMEGEPLFHYFPEIFRLSAGCRYHNCIHVDEPQCAVIQALETGSLSASRYRSYIKLLEEQRDASKYR